MKGVIVWFRDHWLAKILCLFAALLLAVYVDNLKIGTVALNLPVVYRNKPETLSFVNDPPRFMEIKFRGDKEKLNFPTTKLRVEVDLKDASDQRRNYPVFIDSRLFPQTVELLDAPTQVALRFEKSTQKLILLRVTTTGNPKTGFKKGRVILSPDRIRLLGSQERLSSIREIVLPPIDIGGASENVIRTVVAREPESVQFLSPPEIEVTVVILANQEQNQKTVDVPIQMRNVVANVVPTIGVKSVHILVQGDADSLGDVDSHDIDAFLDLAGLEITGDVDNLTFEIPVKAHIKNNPKVTVVSLDPEFVSVKFEKKK
ncbi:MAG: YbbR-like domain-containing protein [Leptospirales bacterium]|nr:YbbR-like domain-containing protein [Leptospirales bacterium]